MCITSRHFWTSKIRQICYPALPQQKYCKFSLKNAKLKSELGMGKTILPSSHYNPKKITTLRELTHFTLSK